MKVKAFLENSKVSNFIYVMVILLCIVILIELSIADYIEDNTLLQEVFIKVYRKHESLQSRQKMKSWLYQITRNTIVHIQSIGRVATFFKGRLQVSVTPVVAISGATTSSFTVMSNVLVQPLAAVTITV